jgi:hypothetical protein
VIVGAGAGIGRRRAPSANEETVMSAMTATITVEMVMTIRSVLGLSWRSYMSYSAAFLGYAELGLQCSAVQVPDAYPTRDGSERYAA